MIMLRAWIHESRSLSKICIALKRHARNLILKGFSEIFPTAVRNQFVVGAS